MSSLREILSQAKYKDSNGHDIDVSEIDCLATYKHIADGFYSWACEACGKSHGDRSCGWSIAGQVLVCEKCLKKSLILRNDVDWVNDKISWAGELQYKVNLLEKQVEELSDYKKEVQDSNEAALLARTKELEARLSKIKGLCP